MSLSELTWPRSAGVKTGPYQLPPAVDTSRPQFRFVTPEGGPLPTPHHHQPPPLPPTTAPMALSVDVTGGRHRQATDFFVQNVHFLAVSQSITPKLIAMCVCVPKRKQNQKQTRRRMNMEGLLSKNRPVKVRVVANSKQLSTHKFAKYATGPSSD